MQRTKRLSLGRKTVAVLSPSRLANPELPPLGEVTRHSNAQKYHHGGAKRVCNDMPVFHVRSALLAPGS